MTGRDLIIYILNNGLEDDAIEIDGRFFGFMSEGEAAVKFKVGIATIRTWCATGIIDGVMMGGEYYVDPDAKCPVAERDSTGRFINWKRVN